VLVESCDGLADGPSGALRTVFAAAGVVALELSNGFEFAEGFGFDGFGFVFGIEDEMLRADPPSPRLWRSRG